jgi:cardiolipin synthase
MAVPRSGMFLVAGGRSRRGGRLSVPSEASGAIVGTLRPAIPDRYDPLFRVGHSVNGFEAVGGNRARLTADFDAAIDSVVADIDVA